MAEELNRQRMVWTDMVVDQAQVWGFDINALELEHNEAFTWTLWARHDGVRFLIGVFSYGLKG